MPKGGARAGAGRKEKPKIPLFADKGVATRVLAMDGPPVGHVRKCKCDVCRGPKNCTCKKAAGEPTLVCEQCETRAAHKICHCEDCGWWELLASKDKRLVFETRRYLTDRREGKPAQGVFLGDTRERARELDFGDLPELIATGQSVSTGKPN